MILIYTHSYTFVCVHETKKCDNNNQCGGFIYPVESPCETCCWTCNISLILMFVLFFFCHFVFRSSDIFTRSQILNEHQKNLHILLFSFFLVFVAETKQTQTLFVKHILFAINVVGNFFSLSLTEYWKYNLCIIASFIWRDKSRNMTTAYYIVGRPHSMCGNCNTPTIKKKNLLIFHFVFIHFLYVFVPLF